MAGCPSTALRIFTRRSGRRVIFIGVNAAWGGANETGVVALEPSGHVRDAGWATGVAAAAAWICDHAEPDTLVFIDAPLVVTNPTGQRLCETHVGQRYCRWSVSANSTNTASRRLGAVALLTALEENGFCYDDGIDGPPSSGRRVSECYPYTTIVGSESLHRDLFRLGSTAAGALQIYSVSTTSAPVSCTTGRERGVVRASVPLRAS
jgi:predicted RNase H-like nuclease